MLNAYESWITHKTYKLGVKNRKLFRTVFLVDWSQNQIYFPYTIKFRGC